MADFERLPPGTLRRRSAALAARWRGGVTDVVVMERHKIVNVRVAGLRATDTEAQQIEAMRRGIVQARAVLNAMEADLDATGVRMFAPRAAPMDLAGLRAMTQDQVIRDILVQADHGGLLITRMGGTPVRRLPNGDYMPADAA
jgi:hypothetical protein